MVGAGLTGGYLFVFDLRERLIQLDPGARTGIRSNEDCLFSDCGIEASAATTALTGGVARPAADAAPPKGPCPAQAGADLPDPND